MLEHTFSDLGIRCTVANLSGRHLNPCCNDVFISLFVTLWKCSARWFWHVYISRITFGVFKLSLSKISWCMQVILGIYLFQWSVHGDPPDRPTPHPPHFFPMILDHPHPSISFNACLGHAFCTAHASIVNMADQEILIHWRSSMKCCLCSIWQRLLLCNTNWGWSNSSHILDYLVIHRCRIMIWKNVF